jgi:ABC-type proline/glycine betaine transport system permease subunit
LRELGILFAFATLSACAVLHILTFLIAVPRLSILVPFLPLLGAALCARQALPWRKARSDRASFVGPKGKMATVGWVLLAYSIVLFAHFYRISGGATGVGIVDGQYVYLNKSNAIQTITEAEYKMFPSQCFRVMTGWMGMVASFCLSSLLNAKGELNPQQPST